MRNIHVMNANNRDATVNINSIRHIKTHKLGKVGSTLTFQHYLAAGEHHGHLEMQAAHGEDYGQALLDGDPEVDLEMVGRHVAHTDVVYLSGKGDVLYAPPKMMEVIFAPDGTEKERREPQDVAGDVNEELPVRWSGRKLPKSKAVRQFFFKRTIQLQHVDGLTYDFLYAMAKELHEEKVMVLLGGGKSGKEPLIFQTNGKPHRGFLEGRIDGSKYMLLLHLSNMELKRPAPKE